MAEPTAATVPQYNEDYQQQMNKYYSSYFGGGKTPDQPMLSEWYNSTYQAPVTGYQKPQQSPSNPLQALVGGSTGGSSQGLLGGSGSGVSSFGGQGVSQDAISAGLKMLAASENPAIRAMSPIAALLMNIVGGQVTDGQINGMSAADAKLAASAALKDMGIGTVSDEDGNVRTFSSADSVDAADRTMFGGGGSQSRSPGFGSLGNSSFGEGQY